MQGWVVKFCRLFSMGFLLLVCLAGFSCTVERLDKRDRRDPLIQKARMKQEEGDYTAAIRLYQEALEHDPGLAKAHLDVALLLHDAQKDYVAAIYHYRRYLDSRPGAEKKEMIENRIRLAEQLFAAGIRQRGRPLAGDPSGHAATQILSLEQEVADLKDEIQRLKNSPREVRPEIPAGMPVSSYQVKSGDTLSSIAFQVYGDSSAWDKIRQANSDLLGGSTVLKVGQVLVIP